MRKIYFFSLIAMVFLLGRGVLAETLLPPLMVLEVPEDNAEGVEEIETTENDPQDTSKMDEEPQQDNSVSSGGGGGFSGVVFFDADELELQAELERELLAGTEEAVEAVEAVMYTAQTDTEPYHIWFNPVPPSPYQDVYDTSTPWRAYQWERMYHEYINFYGLVRSWHELARNGRIGRYRLLDVVTKNFIDRYVEQMLDPDNTIQFYCSTVFTISYDIDMDEPLANYYFVETYLTHQLGVVGLSLDGRHSPHEIPILKEYQRRIGAPETGHWDIPTYAQHRKYHNCTSADAGRPRTGSPYYFHESIEIDSDGMVHITYPATPAIQQGSYGTYDVPPPSVDPDPGAPIPVPDVDPEPNVENPVGNIYSLWVYPDGVFAGGYPLFDTSTEERAHAYQKVMYEFPVLRSFVRAWILAYQRAPEHAGGSELTDAYRASVAEKVARITESPFPTDGCEALPLYTEVDTDPTGQYWLNEHVLKYVAGIDGIALDGVLDESETLLLEGYQASMGMTPTGLWDVQTYLLHRKRYQCTSPQDFGYAHKTRTFYHPERLTIENDGTLRVDFPAEGAEALGDYDTFDGDPYQPVIIFVPGIYGSTLGATASDGSQQSRLWPSQYLLNTDQEHKRLTRNSSDPLYDNSIHAHDVMWSTSVAPPAPLTSPLIPSDELLTVDLYEHAREVFADSGMSVHPDTNLFRQERASCSDMSAGEYDVFPFPYDWRMGNDASAQELARFVQCVRGAHPYRPLVVFGHSMGGLVAQRMIAKYGGDDLVDQLITGGTPWTGAVTALNTTLTGDNLNVGNLPAEMIRRDTVLDLVPYFDSTLELLPWDGATHVGAPLVVETVDANGDGIISPFSTLSDLDPLYQKQLGHHRAPSQVNADFFGRDFFLFDNDVVYHTLVGNTFTHTTPVQLRTRARRCPLGVRRQSGCNAGKKGFDVHWDIVFGDGDGTVHDASARYLADQYDIPVTETAHDHDGLGMNPQIIEEMLAIARGGEIDAIAEINTTQDLPPSTMHYITMYGVTEFVFSAQGVAETVISDGADIGDAGEIFWQDGAVTLALDGTSGYRISQHAGAVPFDVFVTTQENQDTETRYLGIAGQTFEITNLQISVDGTLQSGLVLVRGVDDFDPPVVVTTQEDGLVTVATTDASEHGTWYAIDEGGFVPYTAPFALADGQTGYIFAEDVLGNISKTQTVHASGSEAPVSPEEEEEEEEDENDDNQESVEQSGSRVQGVIGFRPDDSEHVQVVLPDKTLVIVFGGEGEDRVYEKDAEGKLIELATV